MELKKILLNNRLTGKFISNIVSARTAHRQYKMNIAESQKMKAIKDIHKGERCFIIGTGPSLTIDDLEKLKNEYTFGTHRIYELFKQTTWRPTYYVCQDHALIKDRIRDNIIKSESEKIFIPMEFSDEYKGDRIYHYILKHKDYFPNKAEFSTDLTKYLAQGYTVSYASIQIAAYMGFTEIYLLGIDHSYNLKRDKKGNLVRDESIQSYAAGMEPGSGWIPRTEDSTIAYEAAEAFSRKHGFRIYNATRGGKLQAFERVNFDDLF